MRLLWADPSFGYEFAVVHAVANRYPVKCRSMVKSAHRATTKGRDTKVRLADQCCPADFLSECRNTTYCLNTDGGMSGMENKPNKKTVVLTALKAIVFLRG